MATENAEDEPASDDIAGGEEQLAEGEAGGRERCRPQDPGEERSVAVGGAIVGRVAHGDALRGVGEDIVVDVGVLEVRVCVLPETVDEEAEAQQSGGREDDGGS